MPRRRSRFSENREARRSRSDGFDPSSAMRLAGFVAILLVFIAVGAGFHGERVTGWIATSLGQLGPLVEPRVFGASLAELAVLSLVIVLAAWVLWRSFRR